MWLMQLQVQLQKKKKKNNVLTKKQTRNKVLRNIFTGFEVRRKVGMMFRRPKDGMKSKCYVFRGYNKRNKVSLVYLARKIQENRHGGCIFNLKC